MTILPIPMSDSTPPGAKRGRGRGRPTSQPRQQQMSRLLDAAAAEIGNGNFVNVTMDSIARAAGVSKKTLYVLVTSKEELISQLVARDMSSLELLLCHEVESAEALQEELRKYMLLWARLTLSPLALGIFLMAVQGRESAPGLARIWYREGAERCLSLLRGWLTRMASRELIAPGDIDSAVELIDSLLISQPLKLFGLGIQSAWTDDQINQRVTIALDAFRRCYVV